MYYIFYKTTNNINGKYYYGVHQSNVEMDSYLGSGVYLHRAINKYGAENFTRQNLKYFDTKDEMFEYEHNYITDDLVKDPMCYNVTIGGKGGSIAGELNPLYGTTFTDEHCKNISKSLSGKSKSKEHRKHLSESRMGHEPWNKGKTNVYSEETLQRIGEHSSKYWIGRKRNSEQYQKCWETRRKKGTTNTRNGKPQSEHQKETLRNLKWMTNGSEIIRVNVNDVELFLYKGYKLGRKL